MSNHCNYKCETGKKKIIFSSSTQTMIGGVRQWNHFHNLKNMHPPYERNFLTKATEYDAVFFTINSSLETVTYWKSLQLNIKAVITAQLKMQKNLL